MKNQLPREDLGEVYYYAQRFAKKWEDARLAGFYSSAREQLAKAKAILELKLAAYRFEARIRF
jgi:hypothetical protein